LKFQQIWAKLQCPLDDAPVGVFIAQNVSQRKLGDHFNGVSVKIMAQFTRGNQDGIEQLLDLGVTGLGLVEYLADEVY
jgi:hypothetical protein